MRTGMCSVTLRRCSPAEVVTAAVDAGLRAVEWAGDTHVPPGEPARAAEVRTRCADAGLRTCSYGSYLWAGDSTTRERADVLAATVALGAGRVRVWAGRVGSGEATAAERDRVRSDLVALCRQAADVGVTVALEYHAGSLADTPSATRNLIEAVAEPNLTSYWQPPLDLPDARAVADFRAMSDLVSALHVFSCWPGAHRLPLSARAGLWAPVLAHARTAGIPDALLEFVPDDDPDVLAGEAGTLRRLANQVEASGPAG